MKTGPFGALSTVATYVTEIAVDGTVEDTFKQDSKTTYNVDVTDSYSVSPREDPQYVISKTGIDTASGATVFDFATEDGGGGAAPLCRGYLNSNNDGRSITYELYDGGGTKIAEETLSSSFAETSEYQNVARVVATDGSGGTDTYEAGVQVRDGQTISSSHSVAGVTQS